MGKRNYIKGCLIPKDIFQKAGIIGEANGLSRMDGFKVINGINPPTILNIKKIRKPKSKHTLLQIDTRYILRL